MLIFLNTFIIFCMFIIGTLFGSFFSLAIYRIPKHEDIVATRSYCPNCKHKLEFFDLIPILSYIIRRGKCKYCGSRISLRYFLLETINGVFFVILYLIFGYNLKLFLVYIIYAVLFVIIGSMIMKNKMNKDDIKDKKMRNEILKTAKKSGVFISELVIAILLFITLITTALVTSKNYNSLATKDILKSNAHMIAVKNIEMCLATDYTNLSSYNLEEKIDNTIYKINVDVTSINNSDFSKEDVVKIIDVSVSYSLKGVENIESISTVKGKV